MCVIMMNNLQAMGPCVYPFPTSLENQLVNCTRSSTSEKSPEFGCFAREEFSTYPKYTAVGNFLTFLGSTASLGI